MQSRFAIPSAVLAVLALSLLVPVPSGADDVFLTNGRSFKGVIAEETGSQVRIRMPGGELSLPSSQVARVEKSESSYAEFLHRRQALGRSAGAAEWLALARWAHEHGLEQGAREAAFAAAAIEPRIEGLAPLMRRAGYVLDSELDRWIPYADSMRRRGFVEVNGQWLGRQELAERQRVRDEESQRRAIRDAAEAAAAASRAQRALVELTLYRENQKAAEPQQPTVLYQAPYIAYPGYVYTPSVPVPPPGAHPGHPGHSGPGRDNSGAVTPPYQDRTYYGRLIDRQPGSLLPLDWSTPYVSGHSRR